MRRFVFALIAISAFYAVALAQDAPDTIVWLDYARGVETAKAENKPMLVFFYRDSCPYCQKLGHGALLDTTLAVYINENIVPIRVNTESRRSVMLDSLKITESQLANDK